MEADTISASPSASINGRQNAVGVNDLILQLASESSTVGAEEEVQLADVNYVFQPSDAIKLQTIISSKSKSKSVLLTVFKELVVHGSSCATVLLTLDANVEFLLNHHILVKLLDFLTYGSVKEQHILCLTLLTIAEKGGRRCDFE